MNQLDPVSDVHTHGLDIKSREIYLHGYEDGEDDPGVDYRMASKFIKNIRILESINANPILIHMCSTGGNWNDGFAMYDAIKMCKSYVIIVAYAQAESMSSILLQAADKRVMTPYSYFMCHYGSIAYDGNTLDVMTALENDKRYLDSILSIYTSSAKNGRYFKETMKNPTETKVRNFIERKMRDGDWHLSAKDSVYYGFADAVIGDKGYESIDDLKYT